MKMSSLSFIESYVYDNVIMERIREHIYNKGHTGHTPRKWKKDLPKVPKKLIKNQGVDETIWVLIRYIGANELIVIKDDYIMHNTPIGIQRAICINLTSGERVGWSLYQNTASDIKHNDVKEYIRTYQVC